MAIHDSELTRALETTPASGATPTGYGTTGNQWWPTNWHYFVMPDSIKEALRSDGTAFTVIGDSNIAAGILTNADGSPKYPIVISLASEAIQIGEIAQLTNYVAAGGFLFVGSSSFTRNTNGTSLGDFAIANAMGIHMVTPGLTNWTPNFTFSKLIDHPLIAHIPDGSLFWHMPLSAELTPDPYPTHPPGVPDNPHLIWQVQPSDAVAIAWGDANPYILIKKYGNGYFIYDAAMDPLLCAGGFGPAMYSYAIFRHAIEWAFQTDRLPIPKLSSWPYQYNAAVIFRHDMEAQPYLIESILPSAQFEHANGATGDYYFCTGELREDMPTVQSQVISNLQLAVSLGATVEAHNGGLTNINPYVPPLTTNDYDYWHWGPDDILDVTNEGFNGPVMLPAGYTNNAEYAFFSMSNAFEDIEGWGLANSNLRTTTAPYFNAGREPSLQMEQALGVKTAGEQKICPFPHWTLSKQTPDLRYSFISLPTSDWYVGTSIAQAMENGHTVSTMEALVDYYYSLGAFIDLYSHSSSDGTGFAGPLASAYVTYSVSKPGMWSANAESIYNWWVQRSNAQISASFATNGNQSVATIAVTGASSTNTSVEIEVPGVPFTNLQVLTNGVAAGTNSYRIFGQTVKVLVGNSVTNAVVSYQLLPVAQNDFYTTAAGAALNVSAPGVLANDTAGAGGGVMTASLAGNPLHGTLAFNANGSFTYTPTNNFAGMDSFTYQAVNGALTSAVATATITVSPSGDLFYDGFSRPTNSSSIYPWVPALGAWSITNQQLIGTSTTYSHGFAYIDNTNWADYTVQAQIQFTATNAWGGGIGGRLNATSGAHYAAWVFPEKSGGPAVLQLIKFAGWWTPWNVDPLVQVTLPAVGTSWHTLALTFQGTNISVNFDGVPEISTSDSSAPYANGGITVDLYSDTTAYALAVSNVIVTTSAPVTANNDAYNLLSGTTLTVAPPGVLANDSVADGGSLTAVLVNGPSNGMLLFPGDGSFSYTPATNFVGTDSFTYEAVSGQSTSAVATVTIEVMGPSGCVQPPSGLIGWWPGDGNANDYAGTNDGILEGGATATAPGMVGTAFSFDGTNGFVQVPDSPVFRPTNLTVEAWVLFYSLDSSSDSRPGHQYMVFKQNTQSGNFEGFGLGKDRIADINPNGDFFYFNVSSSNGVTAEVDSFTTVTTNVWYHVAGVRGPDYIQLYVNGQLEGQAPVAYPQDYGDLPLYFGTTGQSYWDGKLNGELDEVSLYNRPLSSNEISAIYLAGSAGKCKEPTISTQPQDQTGVFGGTVTFGVVAEGNAPLSYQWLKNNLPVTGATNAALVLTNLQSSDAAGYSVVVSNSFGFTPSQVATLTVNDVAIVTQPSDVATNAGSTVTFTVTTSGTTLLTYQWYENGTNALSDNGHIQGSQTATLTINNSLGSDDGQYSVTIASTNTSVTSSNASLVVADPVITNQPVGLVKAPGAAAVFTVGAYGTQPLSYQWFKGAAPLTDGGNVSGSGTATLSLSSVSNSDAAGYSAVVGNSFGSVTSSIAMLQVTTLNTNSGAVLFSDNFVRSTDPGPIAPWVAALGGWTVTGQKLEVTSLTSGGLAEAYVPGSWSNYTVQGQVEFPAGSYGGGLGGYVNSSTGARYAAWIYPEGSPGGSDVLSLIKFFDWTTWSYTPMQEVVLTNGVGTSWHSLQLAFQGNQILVNYDGNQVMNVTDNGNSGIPPYTSGGISADVWASSPSLAMLVSNVIVTPLIAPDAYSVNANTTLAVTNPGVLSNDIDIVGTTMTATVVSGPSYGILNLNPSGGFTYLPTNNFVGTDSFVYQANDGSNNLGTATVTITVVSGTPVLTVTVNNQARAYGTTNPVFTVGYSGFVNGDTTNVLTGAPIITTTATNNSPIGNYAITISQGTLSASNYNLAFVNGTLSVTQAVVSVSSGLSANNKVYDGTTAASLTTNNVVLNGVLAGDAANVVLVTNGYVANFTSANVSNNVPVTVSGLTLTGSASGNYTLTQPTNLTANITGLGVTISSGLSANSKVYDGTTAASLTTNNVVLNGVLAGDAANVVLVTNGYVANFTSANASNNVPVTVSRLTLTGSASGNYTLTQPTNLGANITPKVLTIVGVPSPVITSIRVTNGIVTITWTSVTNGLYRLQYCNGLSGSVWSNLSPDVIATGLSATQTENLIGGSPRFYRIMVPNPSFAANNKVYDGTTTATISSNSVLLNGVLTGDVGNVNVTTNGYVANFAGANVGTGIPVMVNGLALTGPAAVNYTLSQPVVLSANITPITLTVSAVNQSKTYGLPNPALTVSYSGFVNGEGTNVLAGAPGVSTTATTSSPPGTYPVMVSAGTLNAANYLFTFVNGTLTVVAVPQLSGTVVNGNQFIITWATIVGTYQLEYKDNLAATNWTLLGSPIAGTGNSIIVTNLIGASPQRFFRLVVSP
ncbi:MAG TPA: YDG domain-containing protein [Verrucomicrobiae bacterium]|nr:YDG domain-containing protein [Verrucomicrobiae bacterium]